jgi:hypothetical protein
VLLAALATTPQAARFVPRELLDDRDFVTAPPLEGGGKSQAMGKSIQNGDQIHGSPMAVVMFFSWQSWEIDGNGSPRNGSINGGF